MAQAQQSSTATYIGLILTFIFGVALWTWSAHERGQYAVEQSRLLAKLEALHTPAATGLVNRWLEAHASPDSGDISTLTLIVAKVQADPTTAPAIDVSPAPTATTDYLQAAYQFGRDHAGALLVMLVVIVGVGYLFGGGSESA